MVVKFELKTSSLVSLSSSWSGHSSSDGLRATGSASFWLTFKISSWCFVSRCAVRKRNNALQKMEEIARFRYVFMIARIDDCSIQVMCIAVLLKKL